MDLFTQCENYIIHCNNTDGGNKNIYELAFYFIGNYKITANEIQTLKNYFFN